MTEEWWGNLEIIAVQDNPEAILLREEKSILVNGMRAIPKIIEE